MGFYIRKSVSVGPFRFNLSNSGIGVSTGIPGLRIGTGPRGTYVHMGRGGLYYRQTLTGFSPLRPAPRSSPAELSSPDWTHGPMFAIGSGSVAEMMDSNFGELLEEIETRRRRITFFPIVLVASLILVGLLIFNQAPNWVLGPCLIFFAILAHIVAQIDRVRKTVVLMYDLEDTCLSNYQTLHAALEEIARCGAVWHVTAEGNVHNRKYHAGASSLIERRSFSMKFQNPPWIQTNLLVPCLVFHKLKLYLLPDLVLVHAPDGYAAIDYAGLRFDANPIRFVESQSVPRDAVVVDHTFRYVNKDGGPDRRFNYNPFRLSVRRTETLELHGPQ
jgi:hypothetical protein